MNKYFILLIFSLTIGFPFHSVSHAINTTLSGENEQQTSQSTNIDSSGVEDNLSEFNIRNINTLLQNTEKLIKNSEVSVSKKRWIIIDSIFSKNEIFLEQEYEYFNTRDKQSLSKFFLTNSGVAWSNYRVQIKKWQTELDNHLAQNIKNLKLFLANRQYFKEIQENLVAKDFPSLAKRVDNIIVDIDAAIAKYHRDEQQLLILQSRIYDKDFLCEMVLKEIEELEANLRKETFSQTKPAIWNISLKGVSQPEFDLQFEKVVDTNNKSLKYYFSSIGYSVIKYLFIIAFIVFIILLIRRNYKKLNITAETPGHVNVERVLIKNPIYIIASLMILFWFLLFPFIPLVFSDFLVLTLLILLYVIAKEFDDNKGKQILRILIFLFLLNTLEVIIWYLGDYSRIYLLFETGISIALIYPLFINYFIKPKPKNSINSSLVQRLVPIIIVLYIIAFIGNIFGFINLTVLFTKIAIRSAGIVMIAVGFSRILTNISFASLKLLETKLPEFYLKYGNIINKRAKNIINIAIFIFCSEYLLRIFEIKVLIYNTIGAVFTKKADLGSISLSLSNIILFIGILYITFLISVFIKRILEEEILRKMKMPRGVPAAISMILRIFFVSLGILFALSAAEINVSNIVVLIGALGVGIGFGLQNIVLNFISGLILIFERPIQTGDTIEVNNLTGRVKDIGIRASNVTTYDGAEVVVPNSNLISNELINWTLSDSKRRVEVKVGTAYGSDPNQVLELLRKVALNHPNVYKNPEPRPLFEGFGDSSLDFRLLFWVHYENGLATKSDIAVAIYNILAENNIEIPFPQVDLHVKNLPAEKKMEQKDDNLEQEN